MNWFPHVESGNSMSFATQMLSGDAQIRLIEWQWSPFCRRWMLKSLIWRVNSEADDSLSYGTEI